MANCKGNVPKRQGARYKCKIQEARYKIQNSVKFYGALGDNKGRALKNLLDQKWKPRRSVAGFPDSKEQFSGGLKRSPK